MTARRTTTDHGRRGWLATTTSSRRCCRRYFDVVADRAEGSWVWDVEGRRYLDLGSGIAVTNTGHRHPHVVDAIHRQVERAAAHVGGAEAPALHRGCRGHRRAGARSSTTPRCSSATAAPRRSTAPSSWPAAPPAGPGIVAFRRGFHGRTMGATTLTTAKAAYQEGYAPLLPDGAHRALLHPGATAARHDADAVDGRAGRARRDPRRRTPARSRRWSSSRCSARAATSCRRSPGSRACGERCDDHGILLVFDEVQCGFGRTGRPFAAETFGVAPRRRALRQGRGLRAARWPGSWPAPT